VADDEGTRLHDVDALQRAALSQQSGTLPLHTLKSEEDFRAKVHRGGGDGKHKVANFIAMIDACAPQSPTLRLLAMYRRRH